MATAVERLLCCGRQGVGEGQWAWGHTRRRKKSGFIILPLLKLADQTQFMRRKIDAPCLSHVVRCRTYVSLGVFLSRADTRHALYLDKHRLVLREA